MFIVQLAAALGIFSILMGFGAEKAIQYAQSRLPYSTAQRVVQATNFVGNAANSYYNQYCSSGTCSTTGLNYPRVQDLVSAGYLPSGQGYSSCNCYTTKDGSVIKLNAGSGPSGTFGMTVTPGAMLASKPAYASMVASRIPGSVLSGNMISVSQPVPALANIAGSLATKYVQVNPSGTQSGNASLSGNLSSGSISTGPISSNGQQISTGNGSTMLPGDNSGVWRWGPPAIVYTGNFCNCNGYPTVSGYASVAQGVPGGYYNATVIPQPNGCNGFGWPVYNCLVSPVDGNQCEVYITSPGGDTAPWAEWLLNVSDSTCYRP